MDQWITFDEPSFPVNLFIFMMLIIHIKVDAEAKPLSSLSYSG